VAKRGVCSNELIPNRIFPIFGSRLHLSFVLDASIFLPFSCLVRRWILQVQVQVPRRFRRRSPLAQLSASSTLLMLAILPKTIVANPDMLSNSRFRLCNYQCNWCRTISKFYANTAIKTFSFEKTSPSLTLSFCIKICGQITEALLFLEHLDQTRFCRSLRKFFKASNVVMQVDKICS
jgi:hypothetical protein